MHNDSFYLIRLAGGYKEIIDVKISGTKSRIHMNSFLLGSSSSDC